MKEVLFEFYENEVRSYSLVFKHMKKLYYINQSLVIFGLLDVVAIVFTLFLIPLTKIPIAITSIGLLFITISLCFVKSKFDIAASKIVRRNFGFSVKKRKWNSAQFKEYQRKKIIEFLIEHDLFVKWKIEKLIEQYNIEIKNIQMPRLVAPGILIAVSVPNISQYISFLYTIDDFGGVAMKTALVIMIFVCSILIIQFLSMLHWMKQDIENDFFSPRAKKIKYLIEILEEVLLHIPTENTKVKSYDTSIA